MKKNFLIAVSILVLAVFIGSVQVLAAKKEDPKKEQPVKKTQPAAKEQPKVEKQAPVVPPVPNRQLTFGVVGNVEYITFNDKEKNIVIKDGEGKSTNILLDDLKKGSMILVTYRKENDKNELITLSVVKSAEAPQIPSSGK